MITGAPAGTPGSTGGPPTTAPGLSLGPMTVDMAAHDTPGSIVSASAMGRTPSVLMTEMESLQRQLHHAQQEKEDVEDGSTLTLLVECNRQNDKYDKKHGIKVCNLKRVLRNDRSSDIV